MVEQEILDIFIQEAQTCVLNNFIAIVTLKSEIVTVICMSQQITREPL